MTTAHKLTTALAVALAVLIGFMGYGWLKEHDARLTLSAQNQAAAATLATIKSNEDARTVTLASALGKVADLQAATKTTPQIIEHQAQLIPDLPAPIRTVTPAEIAASPDIKTGDVVVPAADVHKVLEEIPTEDATCQANIASDTTEITDLKATVVVLNTAIAQRDQALKGGTKIARIKTGLKWFATGAAVTAVVILTNKK